jgi:hypothetical protein
MEWHEAIAEIKPHIFHISTPQGSGTGWLVSLSKSSDLCAIATAAHVVDYAHFWELPIRVTHAATGKSVLVREADRALFLNNDIDSAALVIHREGLTVPDSTIDLMSDGFVIKPGVEVGWMGYPAFHQTEPCFFSGRISLYDEQRKRYLVDGVAINGVSGGPTFRIGYKKVEMIGIVSAYWANRSTGELLPGLAVIQDVSQYYDVTRRFKSMDEVKAVETPASDTKEATKGSEPSASP